MAFIVDRQLRPEGCHGPLQPFLFSASARSTAALDLVVWCLPSSPQPALLGGLGGRDGALEVDVLEREAGVDAVQVLPHGPLHLRVLERRAA